MATKITRQILEAYLNCKVKGYLTLAGQQGNVIDYERMLAERRQEVKARFFSNILARHSQDDVIRESWLTLDALLSGPTFLLEPLLETERFSLRFDGLKRVAGPSKLGDFHYVPILLHGGDRVRTEQKLLLELLGLILSSVQGRQPVHGVINYGDQGIQVNVHLGSKRLPSAKRYLDDLLQVAELTACPKLVLNEHCRICEFKERCQAQAIRDDDLSLLHGMGEKEIKRYNRKGIFTLTQLSCTFRPRRRSKRTKTLGCTHYWALQALAIREKRIFVNGTPALPDRPIRVFLDVEGNSDGSFIYLIGVTVVDHHEVETSYSFWANTPEQEKQIFESFMNVLSAHSHPCVFHYGSYETRFLRRMIDQTSNAKLAKRIQDGTTDILSVIRSAIYFPTFSIGLKDIGKYLGCVWTDRDASGIQSLVWRRRWEKTLEEPIKNKLITYNLEDCGALRKVTELVYTIIEAGKPRGSAEAIGKTDIPIGWTDEFRSPSGRPDWRRQSFSLPAFEAITKCAYFDYQRERVFLRTSKTIRRTCSKGSVVRPTLQSNRNIRIRANRCPQCKSSDIARSEVETHVKVAYDLRFSDGGIRRQVIHCMTTLHKCRECHATFLPERYKRRDKHFHGLKSWMTYQHVVHRISLNSLPAMLHDCFGLHVLPDELYTIRSLMAKHYQATVKGILRKMLAGGVIHIDETQVGLQRSKGYVWVLTSLEEVLYIYRPTREGDFLAELLKGFDGVLISDFYSAYDSLPCKQQKCLIHLIRDMNSDLLSEPYNEEFKSLAFEFGECLRAIIVTIDQYGLFKRHLHKHIAYAHFFIDAVAKREFQSDLALKYQKRLTKYRTKLFTFLNHDGVPWNNNNAECALKQFAEFRKLFDGRLREAGLSEYLVLLSIQQTCKYKGISFLKFLLSKEKDVDTCTRGAQRKYKPYDLEVYPAGYPRKYLLKRRGGNGTSEK